MTFNVKSLLIVFVFLFSAVSTLAQQFENGTPSIRGSSLVCPQGYFNTNLFGSDLGRDLIAERFTTSGDLDPARIFFQGEQEGVSEYQTWRQIDELTELSTERSFFEDDPNKFFISWEGEFQPLRAYVLKIDPSKVTSEILPSFVKGLILRDEGFLESRAFAQSISVAVNTNPERFHEGHGVILRFPSDGQTLVAYRDGSGQLSMRSLNDSDSVSIREIEKGGRPYSLVFCHNSFLANRTAFRMVGASSVNELGESIPARHYLIILSGKFPLTPMER